MLWCKRNFRWILLILVVLAANIFIRNEVWVEKWYSKGFYFNYSRLLRICLGPIPLSLGDLLYIFIIIFLLLRFPKWISAFKSSSKRKAFVTSSLLKLCFYLGWIWVIFNVTWGFNNYRTSISRQLDFKVDQHPSYEDLSQLSTFLLNETNRYASGRKNISDNASAFILKIDTAYSALSLKHPSIRFHHDSFKTSLFGILGNYMGYSGYYNPFTGEAQINDKMQSFTLPFTSLHEVAHQLGYAKENEANFVGYLAAIHSKDSSMLYSANLEMFLYANNALARLDTSKANKQLQMLSDIAKKDLKAYSQFIRLYEGPIDKATTWIYSKILHVNNQPEGMRSYSRVTLWLLGYLKKEKRLY